VAEELGRLVGVVATRLFRYDPDATATVVAGWGRLGQTGAVGTRMRLSGVNIVSTVARTGRPARMEDDTTATGALGAYAPRVPRREAVAGPIVVGGRLWGAMVVSTAEEAAPLPGATEARIEEFAQLVAAGISNVEARSELAASRARILEATDDERRRVVRDLHDGAQQRLVHTVIRLKLARRALEAEKDDAPSLVTEALHEAERATEEVRELAHGILPSVLTRGGLRAGVEALASRSPVPVDIAVSVGRLAPAVEATAYFVVAEALTNVAKHARAHRAAVTARVSDGTLRVEVRDDGVGGARPDGTGLVGLADRLAVLDGYLRIEDAAGGGTMLAARIPVFG
jgi:signal transduction histidine kinase